MAVAAVKQSNVPKSSVTGVVISVNGQIAEVEIDSETLPTLLEILTSPTDEKIKLEVFLHNRRNVSCLVLSSPFLLYRGMKVVGTGSDLKIPVDQSLLGR